MKVDLRLRASRARHQRHGQPTLLGHTERSSPKAARRRAEGEGLDGEGAVQAIIDLALMSVAGLIVLFLENDRRTGDCKLVSDTLGGAVLLAQLAIITRAPTPAYSA